MVFYMDKTVGWSYVLHLSMYVNATQEGHVILLGDCAIHVYSYSVGCIV